MVTWNWAGLNNRSVPLQRGTALFAQLSFRLLPVYHAFSDCKRTARSTGPLTREPPYHARFHDRLLRSRRCPGQPLDPLECGSAADRNACRLGACGWSQPMRRHPSRLGGDPADARYLRLAALCVVIGTVFAAGIAPRLVDRRRRTSPGTGFSATARGLATTLHACCGTCGHSLAMARAGALCLGPRQRACLLADAGYAPRKRLAVVARDPS